MLKDRVCVCVHVYVVYEDTNVYNDMGMTVITRRKFFNVPIIQNAYKSYSVSFLGESTNYKSQGLPPISTLNKLPMSQNTHTSHALFGILESDWSVMTFWGQFLCNVKL